MSRDKHPAAPANGRCDAIVPERLRLRPLLRGAWSAYRACELQCPLDYSLMPLRLRPANQAGDECRSVLQCAEDCHEPDKSPAAPADGWCDANVPERLRLRLPLRGAEGISGARAAARSCRCIDPLRPPATQRAATAAGCCEGPRVPMGGISPQRPPPMAGATKLFQRGQRLRCGAVRNRPIGGARVAAPPFFTAACAAARGQGRHAP